MKMSDTKELGTPSPFAAGAGPLSEGDAAMTATAAASLPSTISEEEKELASSSSRDFEAAKYKDCLAILNRLSTLRPNDNKVKQNKAVAEYMGNGLKFSDTYLNTLNQISESIDEPEALEDLDHCVYYYNKALLYYHLCQYGSALSIGEKLVQFVFPMEDNLARKFSFLMIELYLRTFQPEKALNLLQVAEKLILGNNAGGGANGGLKNSANQSPQQEGGKTATAVTAADKVASPPTTSSSSTSSTLSPADEELWKTRLSLYRARSYVMLRSMKPCKREMKTLMSSGVNSQAAIYLKAFFAYSGRNPRKALKVLNAAVTVAGSGAPVDGKGGGGGPSPLPKAISCGESLASMYYNALGCIHNGLEKHALAALYFRKALDEDRKAVNEIRKNMAPSAKGALPPTSFDGIPVYCIGLSKRPEILYNLGLQLLQSGKPIGAFDCLIEVVQVFHLNPRLWLRLAEACIMASRSSNEDSFEIAQKLRVVECAVGSGIHRKVVFGRGLSPDYNQGSSSEYKTSAIPNATLEFASLCLRNALLLLPSEGSVTKLPDSTLPVSSSLFEDPPSTPKPSTSLTGSASTPPSSGNAADPTPLHPVDGPNFCQVSPSNPIRTQAEVSALRCSILAASAYVALNLNDSVVALSHAKALLAQPKLSGAHKFLGRLYMSEALLNLDNISEAVQHLNPDLVDDLTISSSECSVSRSSNASSPASTTSPSGADAQDDVGGGGEASRRDGGHVGGGANRNWWPKDVTRAKGVVHLNLSVAHVIRGESDKARLNLDKAEELFSFGGGGSAAAAAATVSSSSLPAHFLQARIYLDLLEGDRDRMQTLLKTHFGHVTGNTQAPDTQTPLHNVKWG